MRPFPFSLGSTCIPAFWQELTLDTGRTAKLPLFNLSARWLCKIKVKTILLLRVTHLHPEDVPSYVALIPDHNTGISIPLSTSVWVLLIRPPDRTLGNETIGLMSIFTDGVARELEVAESSTLDQAGDWIRDFLVWQSEILHQVLQKILLLIKTRLRSLKVKHSILLDSSPESSAALRSMLDLGAQPSYSQME